MGICSSSGKKLPPREMAPSEMASKDLAPIPESEDGKVTLTEEEWKERLTPKQFEATRKNGTEPAFSGLWCNHKKDGRYTCICCGAELFSSGAKFDSGTGWPSFYAAIDDQRVTITKDYSHGTTRDAVECSRCNAHLGHVFDDGPKPTGMRYCANSVALDFVPA